MPRQHEGNVQVVFERAPYETGLGRFLCVCADLDAADHYVKTRHGAGHAKVVVDGDGTRTYAILGRRWDVVRMRVHHV
jgi:hypothetical protein